MGPTPTAAGREGDTSPEPPSSSFYAPGTRTVPLALLLIAVVVVFYSGVTRNGFMNYDDDTYITLNPHVKAGLTRGTVKWAFTTFEAANYHPLTWLSHALDCQLFGVDASAHHEISVLLHAINAVLVFLLLQNVTGFRWRSLFVAALFALHPLNVESVAWAAERKNVLSMLFFLLALHAYVAYAQRPNVARYALVAVLFLLSLLSKPQVITLPFLLLLLDYWPLNRWAGARAIEETNAAAFPQTSLGGLILEKLPLFALSAASSILTMKAQRAGGAVQALSLYSPLLRVETAILNYVRYLGKLFWPTDLVVLYPHATKLYPAWEIVAAVLMLGLITASVVVAHRRRYLAVGWLWFLGTLFPMIGLVQVGAQSIADRYTYISFLGLFVMLTWLIADRMSARQIRAAWIATPAFAALLFLGFLTYRQVGFWRDPESFWTRTIELTDGNYIAHDTLAEYLSAHGRIEESAVHYRAALAIRPDDLPANLGLGTWEHRQGNLEAAIDHYWVVALHAGDLSLRAAAYGNLGSAYRQQGHLPQAKQCFEESLKLEPKRVMPMIGLGLVAQKSGDFDEAIRQYQRAMALEPTDVGYLLIAKALGQEGHSDEARAINDRVAKLSPDLPAAQRQAEGLLEGK
jgi:tetratricopeptide (TPR) repeat protein